MAYELKMPQLGLTMEEGTVSKWMKKEGDAVKVGDVVLEITTDKLTNEVTSEVEGTMLKIVAQEGDDVPVFIGGEHGGGAGRFCQMLEVRPREGRDVPERAGAAAVFKKAQAEGVFAVCVLCDDVIVAHGGQKAEHCALGQPCALADGGERHRLARVAEKLQKLHRLRHGADGVAVSHKSALPVKNRCLYSKKYCGKSQDYDNIKI